MTQENIEKVWLTDMAVWIRTKDGREASEMFDNYPRLKWATKDQRESYEANHYGLHWLELDEDLSYDGFFREKTTNKLYSIFIPSGVKCFRNRAKIGYGSKSAGAIHLRDKRPSVERENAIISELKAIGAELQAITV